MGIKEINKPFIQGEIKISRGHEGAGIGLTIAKASVEALGGSLWIDSAPGKGTNVFFTLPG
ncbi:MAG: sensor histidine kinase [Bacteroidales bacterium]|nr:sensor histidine kinase [Bacteroidales bacterium]MCF8333504.1 sensor histidine kinase [Bacteroidales bacterium]